MTEEPEPIEQFSIAVCLWAGAEAVVKSKPDQGAVFAIYLLLGFCIEGALKAFLQNAGKSKAHRLELERRHDIATLLNEAQTNGLSVSGDVLEFVTALSPLHKTHVFRYPKSDVDKVFIANFALGLKLTDKLLRAIAPHIPNMPEGTARPL